MRLFLSFFLIFNALVLLNGQVIINEISYNPPEFGTDSLEYIELFNNGSADIDLTGYSLSDAVVDTIKNVTIAANGYLVIALDSIVFENFFGTPSLEWQSGALNNTGEKIVLKDPSGIVVDSVDYSDALPWPQFADGTDGAGGSIENCDPNSDNNQGSNWRVSTNFIGTIMTGEEVYGTPGFNNTVSCLAPADHNISLEGFEFIPDDITIQVGDLVRWESLSGTHNVNGGLVTFPSNPEGFYSGDATPGPWIFDHVFNTAGVYNYQCDPHVSLGMTGKITVEEAPTPIPSLKFTEIMYNDPGALDSLEFFEIYNYGVDTVDMTAMQISGEVDFIFPTHKLAPENYVVVCKDTTAFDAIFGFMPYHWDEGGGLSNSGGTVYLTTTNTVLVDSVSYDDSAPWPLDPDGFGYSMVLCDVRDNNDIGSNWKSAVSPTTMSVEGVEIFANPGERAYCSYQIGQINNVLSSTGTPQSDSVYAQVSGVVYGINYRPSGLQFTIIDQFNEGIGAFSFSEDFGYTVTEGDQVTVLGVVEQFNGLTQIALDSVWVNSQNNTLFSADVITNLDESTESNLVKMESVYLVDINDWDSSGNGFNTLVTNGTDTINVRIDNDTDIAGMEYPTGTFNITGIGGQYDTTEPYFENYQLLPRYKTDITPYSIYVDPYPLYDIATVSSVDLDGLTDSLDVTCAIQGVVHGINTKQSGLEFTIIDQNNDGIQVFKSAENLGYVVSEGDELMVKGKIQQLFGLTQIVPDSIELLTNGNMLFNPTTVSTLDESTESQLVRILNLSYLDESQWAGNGQTFNVVLTNGVSTFEMVIDNDSELADLSAPPAPFHLIGNGLQFDLSAPFTEAYRIAPRYFTDFELQLAIPEYSIGTITTIGSDGSADSLNVECTITGIVHGINYNSAGLDFTVIDDQNDGIQILSALENEYVVTEGDEISITGDIGQNNGLISMRPDEIVLKSSGNSLFDPTPRIFLNEETESQMCLFYDLDYVDQNEWLGDGSSFDVILSDGNVEVTMRIDDDTELANMTAPPGPFNLTGIGIQDDFTFPFLGDYLIRPRYLSDFDFDTSLETDIDLSNFQVYPNPVKDILNISSSFELQYLILRNDIGQTVVRSQNPSISVVDFPSGLYFLEVQTNKGRKILKVIIE